MIKDIATSMGARFLMISAGIVTSVLTARVLGVAGRGEYFYVITLANLATQFGNLGLASSNTYALAKDSRLLGPLAVNSFWISLGIGAAAAAVILILDTLSGGASGIGRHAWIVVLMAPGMLYALLASNLLVGLSRIRQYNVFQIGSTLFQLAAIAVCAWIAANPAGFLAASAAAVLASAIALGWMLARLHPAGWRFDWRLLKNHLGFAGRAYIATLLGYMVSRAGVFMLERWSGQGELGIYSIAVQFADVLAIVPATVAMVLFPELVKGTADRRFPRTMSVLVRLGAIMALLCIAAGAAAAWMVPVLFGEDFAPSVRVLWWMLPGIWSLGMASVVSQYLASKGIPYSNLGIWLGGVVLLAVTCSHFIPRLGALGAAAGLSITYVFIAMALSLLAWRHAASEKKTRI